MNHPVIPAPVRFDGVEGLFVFRSGTTVGFVDSAIAPIVERFCAEVMRRTGLRLTPSPARPASSEPSVRGELANRDQVGGLPTPLGDSPAGNMASDERHSLAVDAGQIVVRAAEPVGGARGLSTPIQLGGRDTVPERG